MSEIDENDGMLVELDFGRGANLRGQAILGVEILRELGVDDLPALVESAPSGIAAPKRSVQIRHSHHQLAQLLAKGSEISEAGLITGYAPGYISRLVKDDPAFKELVEHYKKQREAVFVDAMERMKILGLSTLDELQMRLEEDPEKFSRRELLEMAEMLLVKTTVVGRGQGGGGGGPMAVAVNVKFVSAEPKSVAEAPISGAAIDVSFEDIEAD